MSLQIFLWFMLILSAIRAIDWMFKAGQGDITIKIEAGYSVAKGFVNIGFVVWTIFLLIHLYYK